MDLFRNPGLTINQQALYENHQDEVFAIHFETMDLANTKLIVYIQPTGKLDFVFSEIHPTPELKPATP
ncbi:hypothetical protein JCM14202_1475 [Agrilactobacillus composti DSM 18527 = JCM 14202]|nr:hypothetical protein [Agrilactobacillus composti]GAF39608.1 hypothetical protein JCM14202_1475 [Agrilactobacillus composti DSM 18527 = JCM 14202]